MPVKPLPPPTGPVSFERFSSVSRHAKETIRRLRTYLRGRRAVDVESLVADARILTTSEWNAALPEQRNNGKLSLSRTIVRWNDVPTHGKIRSTRCMVGNFSRAWRLGSHLSKCHTWTHFSPATSLRTSPGAWESRPKPRQPECGGSKAKITDLYAALDGLRNHTD